MTKVEAKRLLVTGSRHAESMFQHWQISSELYQAWLQLGRPKKCTLIHGDAPGVDSLAEELWDALGFKTEPHPADWSQGKSAGPKRNQEMVDLGADACVAFYIEGVEGRGTDDCARRASDAGIPVHIVTMKEER